MGTKRTLYGHYDRWLWVVWGDRPRLHPWFVVTQAEKGGGPVLREQGSWTKANGFMVRVGKLFVSLQFRRI